MKEENALSIACTIKMFFVHQRINWYFLPTTGQVFILDYFAAWYLYFGRLEISTKRSKSQKRLTKLFGQDLTNIKNQATEATVKGNSRI